MYGLLGLLTACKGVPAIEPLAYVVPCEAEGAAGFMLHSDSTSLTSWLQARQAVLAKPVDFQREVVLIADFGEQPNPAWSIALGDIPVRLDGSTARVEVSLKPPPAGRRVIQQLSHPCAVYRLERSAYRRIELVDGERSLASFELD